MTTASKVVKTQSKGMVTIPIEFRAKLGIDPDSLLEARLVDDGVLFVKLEVQPQKTEIYSDKQIEEWMKSDKLDKKTAAKLKKLLKS